MTATRDLKINGSGRGAGGVFRRVSVTGEGAIDGDVAADLVKVVGTLRNRGSIATQQCRVVGTLDVEGNLSGDDTKVTGTLTVQGDCSAEQLEIQGGISVDGLLNAETMKIRLYGPCRCGDIGGGKIHIRPQFRLFSGNKTMTAASIEGDDVDISYTIAAVVRGNQVRIGPGCVVERVEYRQSFHQDKTAKVATNQRV